MKWQHACWIQALNKRENLHLCVYAQWLEAPALELAQWLGCDGSPSAPGRYTFAYERPHQRPVRLQEFGYAGSGVRAGGTVAARRRQAMTDDGAPVRRQTSGGDASKRMRKKDERLVEQQTQLWLRWLSTHACVDTRAGVATEEMLCAVVRSMQLGHQPALLAGNFDIPAPWFASRIIEGRFGGKGVSARQAASADSAFYPVIAAQMQRWWREPAYTPSLPCLPAATDFQARVQQCIGAIVAGQTATYTDIARRASSAPRAVGQACRRNHLPLIVPCHRVVAADSLGGYLGHGANDNCSADALKRALLHREGARF
ncbi:MAG: methylated-DNA--[protein]-cysteine S-methyltransferase [Proteobacteria bacterium]|nr:methylated-DNA--[protein]-cysteine S-methyltransferase [Pseudomonadota bacterium]